MDHVPSSTRLFPVKHPFQITVYYLFRVHLGERPAAKVLHDNERIAIMERFPTFGRWRSALQGWSNGVFIRTS